MIKTFLKKIFSKREKVKQTPLEFSAALLSCWLITVGCCILLDSFFAIKVGVVTVIWQTLATMVLLVVLTKRWWLPFAAIGTVITASGVMTLLSDKALSIFNQFLSFLNWWFSNLPVDSEWHGEKGFYLVHTFVNIGVTILLFALLRVTKRPWAVASAAVILLVLAYVFGYIEYDLWAIPFMVAGIFPFIASEKFKSKKITSFKSLFGLLSEKWLFAIIATVVSLIICLSSMAVVFTTDGSVRTRFFTDVISDVQTVTKFYTKEQKSLQVSLYDIGLANDKSYVGGDLKDISSAVLAVTDLEESTFVKIAAYDTFDGVNWSNTFDNSYRVNGPWKEEEQKYLSTRLLNDNFYMSTASSMGTKRTVNVRVSFASHVFPTVGQVYNIKEITPNKNQILFDKGGRLLSYYGQEKGFSYSFDTIIYDTKQEILKEQLRFIIPIYGNTQDPLYDPEGDFYKYYTKSFINEPERVNQIIEYMSFDMENYYDKAYEICEFFSKRNGFLYTENPPEFQKGDNIVEKLFETRQGHCVYYATAMIAITRAAGIPSRLAAGYRTVRSSLTGKQVVDRSRPYAWVECYIPHIGWMSFDPTPNRRAISMGPGGIYGNMQKPNTEFEQEDTRDQDEDEELQSPGTKLEWDNGPLVSVYTFVPFVALIVALAVFNTLVSKRFYKFKSIRKRFKNNNKAQALYIYRDMLRQFSWLGVKLKKGETIGELTERTYRILNDDYARMISKGIASVEKMYYGEIEVNEGENADISTARQTLEKALASRNSKAFYVISNAINIIEWICYGKLQPTDEQVKMIFNAHTVLEKELKRRNNKLLYVIKRRTLLPIFAFSTKPKREKHRRKS